MATFDDRVFGITMRLFSEKIAEDMEKSRLWQDTFLKGKPSAATIENRIYDHIAREVAAMLMRDTDVTGAVRSEIMGKRIESIADDVSKRVKDAIVHRLVFPSEESDY